MMTRTTRYIDSFLTIDLMRKEVRILVEEALIEIRLRKPSKTANWPPNEDITPAWAREVLEKLPLYPNFDQTTLKKGLKNWNSDFPPDVDALLKSSKIYESDDIQTSYHKTKNVLIFEARPHFWLLTREELFAIYNYPCITEKNPLHISIEKFKFDSVARGIENWKNLLGIAFGLPDYELPTLPPENAGLLPRPKNFSKVEEWRRKNSHILKMK